MQDNLLEFKNLLVKLGKGDHSYTQILISDITAETIMFKVNRANKQKQCKINCKQNQIKILLKILIESLELFRVKKISIHQERINSLIKLLKSFRLQTEFQEKIVIQQNNNLNQKPQNQLLAHIERQPKHKELQIYECLLSEKFDELVVESLRDFLYLFEQFKISINTITCLKEQHYEQITQIIPSLFNIKYNKLSLTLTIDKHSRQNMNNIALIWLKNYSSCSQQGIQACDFYLTKHQITFYNEGKSVSVFRYTGCTNIQIIFKYPLRTEQTNHIISSLFQINHRSTLTFQVVSQQILDSVAKLLMDDSLEFNCIVLSIKLTITKYEMIFNTSSLTVEQFKNIFNLALAKGRYKVILYSEMQFLEQAFHIFLCKPFIKFQFYLHLCERHPSTLAILDKINKITKNTYTSAISFAVLLKKHSSKSKAFLNSVFQAIYADN